MTKNEFEIKLKKLCKVSIIGNKIMAFVFMIIGIYFLSRGIVDILTKTEIHIINTIVATMIATSMSIFAGILILRLIPKQYFVIEVFSDDPVRKKVMLFKQAISEYNIEVTEIGDILKIRGTKKMSGWYDVYVYVDNEKYLFNIQPFNSGQRLGVTDFGSSKRLAGKIKACLQQAVSPMPASS